VSHRGLADMPARLVVGVVDLPSPAGSAISRRKRVLSVVAFTKAAMASASVGGTGGGFGVASLPREVPAPS
jgi:hypothetical protein